MDNFYDDSSTRARARTPPWIPEDFQVTSGNNECPTANRVLASFAIWNCISIAAFLLFGSSSVRSYLTRGRIRKNAPWTFWSALLSVALQFTCIIGSTFLVRASGYRVDVWQLIQLWAVRPRATWLIANLSGLAWRYGYQNGALDNGVVEVVICVFGCVFVGRLVRTATSVGSSALDGNFAPEYWMATVPGVLMLISTCFEAIWVLWFLMRAVETRGRAEAQDINGTQYIVRTFAPITCLCSWLIWVSFLHSTEGVYCPGNIKFIDAIWVVNAIVVNVARALIDGGSGSG